MASTYFALILLLVLTLDLNPCAAKEEAAAGEAKRNKWSDDVSLNEFKQRFNKTYANCTDETRRHQLLTANKKKIASHNADAARGLRSYTLALNELSDLTDAEYQARLGFRVDRTRRRKRATSSFPPFYKNTVNVSTLNKTVDWRTIGWVSPIVDQGNCGSCWAYAATGTIESQYKNKTKTLVQLSQQNLISCSSYPSATSTGNMGCDGGDSLAAFKWVKLYGQELASVYPSTSYYTGVTGSCKYVSTKSVVKLSNWFNIVTNESAIQQAVAKKGPVVVAIDASGWNFQIYSSGVYTGPCSNTLSSLNHAVQIVGYGTFSEIDYWLIKNSWGTSWGIGGYMMMARIVNMCGISLYGSFPVVGTATTAAGR